jgi:hypothetical protein
MLAEIPRLAIGYVVVIYANGAVGIFSLEAHVYGIVEIDEDGDCGNDQGSWSDAFEGVRVRLIPWLYGM